MFGSLMEYPRNMMGCSMNMVMSFEARYLLFLLKIL